MIGEFDDICEESEDGLERISDIIASLKSFTHEDGTISAAPFDVVSAIKDTLILVAPELKHKAEVELQLDNVPEVLGNSRKLGQVIINLLVNAGQAVTNNGRITLSTRTDSQHRRVVISVKDNGCGISEKRPRAYL